MRKGLANVTLLGDPEAVAQDADRLGLDLAGIKIVDHMVRSHAMLTVLHGPGKLLVGISGPDFLQAVSGELTWFLVLSRSGPGFDRSQLRWYRHQRLLASPD